MKKILYLLIAVVFFASACEQEDNLQRYALGTEFLVSVGDITSLDDNVTVSITNNEKNLTEIAVSLVEGASLGTIAISDGSGSITISGSDLGVSDIEDAADLQFDAVFDSKSIIRYGSLEVSDPISVTDPGVLHKDTTYHFIFEVAPVSATVTGITVETKVSKAGTYAPATPVSSDLSADSIPLLGTDYAVGDTIFVKVTANTATKTAVTVTELVVAPDSYQSVASFTLDYDYDLAGTVGTLSYDLILNREVTMADAADSTDVNYAAYYTAPTGYLAIDVVPMGNLEFVAGTADDYANADILDIEATDFSSPITPSEVEGGDVFIYRTLRAPDVDYTYGILKVVKIDRPEGVFADVTVEFEYKYTE